MPLVPVWDINPLKHIRFQYVTMAIIVMNMSVYVGLQSGLLFPMPPDLFQTFGPRPSHTVPWASFAAHLPEHYKLITYMFFHGDILHLVFNMIFLFVFADNIEDAMGHSRFILFYLLTGTIAAVIYAWVARAPESPLIGASGAVAGVIGAYMILHPSIRVWVLVPLPKLPFVPLRVPAAAVIGAWFIYQFAAAFLLPANAVAWWAHVGGFFVGMVLVVVLKRRDVRIFGG